MKCPMCLVENCVMHRPEEVHRRVMLARTPAVMTDDALTVAQLHDLIVEFVRAEGERSRLTGSMDEVYERSRRYLRALQALWTVSGVER